MSVSVRTAVNLNPKTRRSIMASNADTDCDPDSDTDPESGLDLQRCAGRGKATPYRRG
jgi:hypothetical protein